MLTAASPLSSRLNRLLGPWLLRMGITVQSKVAEMSGKPASDHYVLEHLLLMPLARKIISVEVHNLAQEAAAAAAATAAEKEKGKRKTSRWKEFTTFVTERVWGKQQLDDNAAAAAASQSTKINKPKRNNERLEILERYIRPVLLPTEKWSDVMRWCTMTHLTNWVRSEFLIAKYGAGVNEALLAYPQLRLSPQIQHMKAQKRMILKLLGLEDRAEGRRQSLPYSPAVVKAFHMERWNHRKDTTAQSKRRIELCTQLGGEVGIYEGIPYAQLSQDTDLSSLSLEDVLELSLGQIDGCGTFNALCEDAGILQLWTREYVSGLASYLRNRSDSFMGNTIILHVGEGDGLLANALQEAWKSKRPVFKSKKSPLSAKTSNAELKTPTIVVVATNGKRNSVQEALAKYFSVGGQKQQQQVIVICSWMPPGEDWAALFRQSKVAEYILIGEYDDDNVYGDQYPPQVNDNNDKSGNLPRQAQAEPLPDPFDGYKRQELNKLVPHQFGRLDTAFSKSSTTVSFRLIER